VTDVDLIEALAPICRKHGIRRIVCSGLEMEFEPQATTPDIKVMADIAKAMEEGVPSDEEILFHSVGGVPKEEEV